MIRRNRVQHRFVDLVPDTLEQGVLYICIPYTTALHLCPCGCGEEVVTPIRPTEWSFTFDGVAVSLRPSIGNWNFPCKSHYWITQNRVRWDRRWTPAEITAARREEDAHRARYFAPATATPPQPSLTVDTPTCEPAERRQVLGWLRPARWRPSRRRRSGD